MDSNDRTKQLLYDQFIRFLHVYENHKDTEIEHFLSIAQRESMDKIPQHLTAVHMIDCIGKHEPINNTGIAEAMNLSKASITKIGNKLLEEGFVKRTKMNDNKKESYFRLSPQGKKIFELHERLHVLEAERFYRSLDKYSEPELKIILQFLQDSSMDMESR
ncbi:MULTISPECIES: MarR family transcriptional regulator [Paenibacillus]|uniref:MarR family transcriptional regulator n=1 Tax=Paenibacillus TaxID=44249 RepID=UPI0007BF4579|nr:MULTISPECIES: MarR family transcriptional regulator [Paenibacillus]WDQ30813.1 MarR family transcriptional regulator [Paenibacillus marchantiae]SDK19413.1 DNA-binding transcriptional regulator, MarR family [Paenibacillus sp. OK060]SEA53573.1 DNA-binding transcriptional regulator, MarR family [Paenibacillus sp. 276b]SHN57853.1 DNA-binding transcriptional regulator, MarR family [Paenibacillus sp. ov031]SLK09895.1 DNA-binding transcriptional regulator, MarR family [Paenibacillus sp. RU5A]